MREIIAIYECNDTYGRASGPTILDRISHKYLTDWHYCIDPLLLTANRQIWNDFSEEDRAILRQCALDTAKYSKAISRLGHDDGTALAYLKRIEMVPEISDPNGVCNSNGMAVVTLTPEQLKEFYHATQPVRDKWTKIIGEELVRSFESDMKAL